MIENVSTQLTVFHCFAHCLLPGRAFASLYALLFLEKEAEIGGRALSNDYLVTENQTSIEILQFSELSQRNKGPSFHNLTFLLMLLRYRF